MLMEQGKIFIQKCIFRFLIIILLLVSIVVSFAPVAFATGVKQVKDATDAKNGVVRIMSRNKTENGISISFGSGFGVGKTGEETDIFVTNRHVVFDDENNCFCKEVYVLLGDDAVKRVYTKKGTFVDDTLHYSNGDPARYNIEIDSKKIVRCEILYPTKITPEYPDFAILKAEKIVNGRVALPLLETNKVKDSETVWTIGYPGSADQNYNLDLEQGEMKYEADVSGSQMFKGEISTRGRIKQYDDTYALTHNAQIDHGNSGGPLVTGSGAVIGINTYTFASKDTSYVGYSMSVYIDYAMNKLDELGIHYDTYKPGPDVKIMAAVAGSAVVVVIAVIIMVTRRKKAPVPAADPEYRLQGISGVYAGRRFPIKGNIRMGRDKENNDLVFPDGIGVSGAHCRLSEQGGSVYLMDLNSRNGTWVNGEKLQPGQERKMKAGDSFYVGKSTESFRIEVNGEQKTGNENKNVIVPPKQEFNIQAVSGTYIGKCFPINGCIRMGRDRDNNDLIFPDGTGISRVHCRLLEENGAVYLEDLGSSNGTYLNGSRLQPRQRVLLKERDSFTLAKSMETFRMDVKR